MIFKSKNIIVKKIISGSLEENGYIAFDKKVAIIVDPGGNSNQFIDFIKVNNLNLKYILLTHYHHDHIGAVEEIKKIFQNCKIFVSEADESDLIEYGVKPDMNYQNELSITNKFNVKIWNTPGHTKGGVCIEIVNENIIFTGDTLFLDDIGRCDLKGGSFEEMKNSINEKIFLWDDEILIHPGHGDSGKMKKVRKINKWYLDIIGNLV